MKVKPVGKMEAVILFVVATFMAVGLANIIEDVVYGIFGKGDNGKVTSISAPFIILGVYLYIYRLIQLGRVEREDEYKDEEERRNKYR